MDYTTTNYAIRAGRAACAIATLRLMIGLEEYIKWVEITFPNNSYWMTSDTERERIATAAIEKFEAERV